MRSSLLILCLFLCACGAPEGYEPNLLKKPRDHAKYEADLVGCKDWAKPTAGETAGLIAFGGLADVVMVVGGNDRMVRSESSRIDGCMAGKGYKLGEDADRASL